MNTPGSVTRYANLLAHRDPGVRDDAARQVWERYAAQLFALAYRGMEPRLRARVGPDDLLQSMFASYFEFRLTAGEPLKDRDALLAQLVCFTLRKVRNAVKRERAGRRDYRREAVRAFDGPDGASPSGWLLELADRPGPTPEEVCVFEEELESWFEALPEKLRKYLLWRLEGYTNREISDRVQKSVKTVELNMSLVRRTLARLVDGPTA
jgi:DNA-directed RNA polymerase specialized sigma24 family protein